jgi:hypothetical protein
MVSRASHPLASMWPTSASGREELYVSDASGRGRRLVASGKIIDHIWSADGERIAFAADCAYDFEGGCRKGHVDVVRRDGTGRRVVYRPSGLSRTALVACKDGARVGKCFF